MTNRFGKPSVRHVEWVEDDGTTPMIRLYSGPVFLLLHYRDARNVVDQVHDLCDAYEAQQRDRT